MAVPTRVGLVADTGDDDAVDAVFAEVGERWGGELNILVNAVGPSVRGTFEELTDDQWHQAIDDGVLGMVRCVRSALAAATQGRVGADRQLLGALRRSAKASCCPPTPPPRRR